MSRHPDRPPAFDAQRTLGVANPKAQLESHRVAIESAISRVLDVGIYVHGPAHRAFEQAFAKCIGAPHAVGVASGTDALMLALIALGVGRGDRVLVPSHTASATIAAICRAAAIPVFLDVDERSYVVTPSIVGAALERTRDVKAIVAVHLYGQPADVIALSGVARTAGIALIEDCAQAAGATICGRRVGSIGDAGCFSFYQTKNLGALGDGGMVTVNDERVATRLRCLRNYGWSEDRISIERGFNSRLDEIQAAILSVKLPFLDADNARRREIANAYMQSLNDLPIGFPSAMSGTEHVYHLFVIAVTDRDWLLGKLRQEGVAALVHYPVPNHLQPAYRAYADGALESTETLTGRILSLPIYPELAEEDVQRVVAIVRRHWPDSQ